ncbi:AfsR/SARP family transcriptional regulator [Streptomyces sp. NBC_01497]|uniref:AfsR/SARP family transcriptional regulator n=1 Tax=Streptomyces sp. NBC_01497 TaxID=2903885 RepID=UPI002E2F50FD|nr:AfsR/SARP family transcriptional regulator [Streptomyces sp. NBC_01497]
MPDFGILGQPYAEPLQPGIGVNRRREWVILSALMTRPNAFMSTNTLVDAMWDTEPPRTAREQVMNCLGSIRRAIAASGAADVRLDRVRDGHVFGIDAERIDHVVFSRLCAEAESAKALGRVESSLGRYERALALWRGGVYDGLDVPSFASHAAALEEQRASAAEQYFALSIAAGRGGRVIPHLLRHVGEYPLRERGVALLMTALHGEGRSHDAQAAYARLAHRLREGLAVGPGSEVRRTLDAILNGTVPAPQPAAG